MANEAQPLLQTKLDGVEEPVARTQAIAHRGYKDKYPENTLLAFEAAIAAGAHAIETDLHLSRDGVIMLCHDPTLQRCFGMPGRVVDYDLAFLKTLRTLRAPHEPMPTLAELLDVLARPGSEHVWLLLDIKIDNDHEQVMRAIADTVAAHPGGFDKERVSLGCWTLDFLPLADKYLPDFPVVHIGYSLTHARQFLQHPRVSFNLFYSIITARFLREAAAAGRSVYAWTVNDERWMRWAIATDGVAGVCTDKVEVFLALEAEARAATMTEMDGREKVRRAWRRWSCVMWAHVVVMRLLERPAFWWWLGRSGAPWRKMEVKCVV